MLEPAGRVAKHDCELHSVTDKALGIVPARDRAISGSRLGDSPREDPPSLGDGRHHSPWPPPPSRQPSVPGPVTTGSCEGRPHSLQEPSYTADSA